MTEPYGYDDETEDVDTDDSPEEKYARVPRRQVRLWEKESKAAKAAAEEAQTLRRELALHRAGASNLTERQQRALLASIDGDVTADTVREAAIELGFVQPPPDAPAAQEQQAMERMSEASSGATTTGNNDEDSKVARLRAAAEQGPEAFFAQLQADGAVVTPAG